MIAENDCSNWDLRDWAVAPRDSGRFSDPSSFGGEPAIRWPEGVPEPKSGDPLYEETHAAVYGYEFNGKRYEIGPDGRPQEVAG